MNKIKLVLFNQLQLRAVTFITKVQQFGKGTDFICYDKQIDNNGGIHVIQTFVSDELSGERQIQGRTARQGNKGSYSLILLDSELMIELNRYINNESSIVVIFYDPKRQKYFDGKYPERVRNIQQIKLDHEKSKKQDQVAIYLYQKNFCYLKIKDKQNSVYQKHQQQWMPLALWEVQQRKLKILSKQCLLMHLQFCKNKIMIYHLMQCQLRIEAITIVK
ncbi:Conserved_hypothetical protein [Hexamita inflata]|uniref:SecA family profile domain-containing protein n=1 Tax=Hexamita inflata TaxID=28002 RepID=A0AA86TXA2_9EUKA|nr:Conserved hypothetical protein [Hexamita inflata]